ncbi:TetR family transcriptional regulator [Flavobacterium faecale]|uniref:TetR family transcriptional regulator n=1 Tax=Flavobacterium faecale TaxID=1355330 RepID=A0A2S1LEC7_9FLAO|nr:TetR family transcriptional regulator [Flavobacterium faecale]AWG22087.1 TetR family transcriptional regulator [Flavobacterium faecale]
MNLNTDFNEKQIEILLVAESLFADNGFEGTSIRTIAKEAKINIAMVSYYFGSKEKLLQALASYRLKDLRFEIENLATEDLDPREKMKRLISLYINRFNCNKGIYRILHFELAGGKSNIKLEILDDIRLKNFNALKRIIEEGQAKSIFKKDVTIELITPTILGTFFHVYMNKIYFQNLLQLEKESDFEHYIENTLTAHIHQTIKGLLNYEN